MFLNKAQNLNNLNKHKIKNTTIPNFIFFNVYDWQNKKQKIIEKIIYELRIRICVRSSYYKEDSFKTSLAGKFESFINIKKNKKNILKSVNNLIKQYRSFSKNNHHFLNSYIIVQDFVENSICSGVVTNYTLGDGAPYYTINYNDITSSTSSVTAGDKDSYRVLHISRNSKKNIRSVKFKKLTDSIKKIEEIYNYKPLDIEFAITKNYKVFIFQIRPISTSSKWKKINKIKFNKILFDAESKYKAIKKRNSVYGKRAVFGLMPDWNPAEIIGFQPSIFSYSLYKYLVTDKIWAISREQMGYKKLNNPKLMYSFTGKPYIDLRMSFNSLLPKRLGKNIESKISRFWIDELINKPYFHDKIEFEITDNCYYFGIKKKIKNKYSFLNNKEKNIFIISLKNLTNKILEKYQIDFDEMNKNIIFLEDFRVKTIKEFKKSSGNELKFSKLLIEKCKNLGLFIFSKQARNAFISKKILNSLVENKILERSSYFKILKKLKTVSHEYISDQNSLQKNRLKMSDFNKKYYHLRPNSYDISNKRYNTSIRPNQISDKQINNLLDYNLKNVKNIISAREYKKLSLALKVNKINVNVKNLLTFCIGSLKLRENYKFIFSRSLSDSIELLRSFSKKKNLGNILPYANFKNILNIKNQKDIDKIKKKYSKIVLNRKYFSSVKLPYLIVSHNDFFVSSILLSKPNFITDKNITGKLIFLDGKSQNLKLKNKIIVIENADPGFDWVFAHKIKGLITKFGGINSHMSIRCEELNLPAIIGFGEDNYSKIIDKKYLNINCKLQKVNLEVIKH